MVVAYAESQNVTRVKVEQICALPIRGDDRGDKVKVMDYIHDDTHVRALSLGLRMLVDMVAGHWPLTVLSTFLGKLFSAVRNDLALAVIDGATDFKAGEKHRVSRSD